MQATGVSQSPKHPLYTIMSLDNAPTLTVPGLFFINWIYEAARSLKERIYQYSNTLKDTANQNGSMIKVNASYKNEQ